MCIYKLSIMFEKKKKSSPQAILSKLHPLFQNVRLKCWYYAILKMHDW